MLCSRLTEILQVGAAVSEKDPIPTKMPQGPVKQGSKVRSTMESGTDQTLYYGSARDTKFPRLYETIPFEDLVYTLEYYIAKAVEVPYTYEQLASSSLTSVIVRPFVLSLIDPKDNANTDNPLFISLASDCGPKNAASNVVLGHNKSSVSMVNSSYSFKDQHKGIVVALLVARHDFLCSVYQDELMTGYLERGVAEARAICAELVATRLLYYIGEDVERIAYLTYEIKQSQNLTLPPPSTDSTSNAAGESGHADGIEDDADCDADIRATAMLLKYDIDSFCCRDVEDFFGMNAIQLAVHDDARKFLCAGPVENVVARMWAGKIVFWDGISTVAIKEAHIYEPPLERSGEKIVDIYARLRVPKYRSFILMVNYALLLGLYYALLFTSPTNEVDLEYTYVEIFLDICLAGFMIDEWAQIRDAKSVSNYASDYWSFLDLAVISLFVTFFIARLIGYIAKDYGITMFAYDVLSLEGLLLIPRFFSFLSIFPYYGTLFPCLRALFIEFAKFATIVFILYLGFFTTFTFLGREYFTVPEMFWLLVRVFFGSSGNGFDAADKISPIFGPPLMLVFVLLTNVLLITVMVSILSQKFSIMMHNAREEYVLMFSSNVADAISTSDRVTYFYPPLNLIAIMLRPMRLLLDHDEYRRLRIRVLKITHAPLAVAVYIYEAGCSVYNHRLQKRARGYRQSFSTNRQRIGSLIHAHEQYERENGPMDPFDNAFGFGTGPPAPSPTKSTPRKRIKIFYNHKRKEK